MSGPVLKPAGNPADEQSMKPTTEPAQRPPDHRPFPNRDIGFSLVEVMVAIMLTGTLAVAGMITLRTSIRASSIDRDHSNAHAWLQTASDVLYGAPRFDCGTEAIANEAAVRNYYDSVVQGTSNPRNWPAANISIVEPVMFWDGTSEYQQICFDDSGINLQLIKIEVRDPSGQIVESVQIVKG